MVGLVKLDQLAYSLVGDVGEGEPPLNPTYLDRFTGGSSSGSAAAVAGGVCDLGLGTDTGASIRVPAASCGLFSIRPSHGAVSASGVLPLAPSFDVVGLLARESALLSAGFEAIAEQRSDSAVPLERVLVPRDDLDAVEPEVREAVLGVTSALAHKLSVEMEEASLAGLVGGRAADLFTRLQAREIWTTHGAWVAENRSVLAPDVAARLERAESLSRSSEAEKATDARALAEYRGAYESLVPPGTAVALPVIPGLPPLRDATAGELSEFRVAALGWMAPASLTGSPQVVVPFIPEASKSSYGVGLLGAPGQERALLSALRSVRTRRG